MFSTPGSVRDCPWRVKMAMEKYTMQRPSTATIIMITILARIGCEESKLRMAEWFDEFFCATLQ